MEEKKTGKVHGLTLKERKYGKLTGVQDIHSFNENEILLQTEAGKVQIKGEQLHVKSLDLEKGEAEICLLYTSPRMRRKKKNLC